MSQARKSKLEELARPAAQQAGIAPQHTQEEADTVVAAQQVSRLRWRHTPQHLHALVPLVIGPGGDALVHEVRDLHRASEARTPLDVVAAQELGRCVCGSNGL